MTSPIPNTEPASVNAGDTVKWSRAFVDYSAADGWTLTYTFVNAGNRFQATATPSGGAFLVNVGATTTADWVAGAYDWRAQVSNGTEIYTVDAGRMTVLPAFGAAVDARTQARRSLEAVEAVLEGRASSSVQEYQIAGRQLRHMSIPDLLTLRDRLRADVAAEDAAAGLAAGLPARGRIQVRFGP